MSTTCTGVLNGSNGSLSCDGVRLARLTAWSATATSGTNDFADSDSGGYTQTFPTRRQITGSADFKISTDFPQWDRLREGECCDLVLNLNSTLYIDIPIAVITSFAINVNIEDLEVEEGTIEFSSSGRYYMPGEAGAHAHVQPAAPT